MASSSHSFTIRGTAKVQNAISGLNKVAAASRKAKNETAGKGGLASTLGQSIANGNKLGGTLVSLAGRFGGYGLAAAAAIVATDKLVGHTIRYDSVMKSLPYSIDAAKDAALGMIDSFELSQIAVKANRLGVAQNSQEFEALADAATKLALSMGQEVAPAINDIITGIGRQSPLILDNLGIMVDVDEANRKYATSLGKTAGQLTDNERKLAFNAEALYQAQKAADASGVAVGKFSEAWVSAKNAMTDWLHEAGSDTVKWLDRKTEEITRGWRSLANIGLLIRGEREAFAKAVLGLEDTPELSAGLNLMGMLPDEVRREFEAIAGQQRIQAEQTAQQNKLEKLRGELLKQQQEEMDKLTEKAQKRALAEKYGIRIAEIDAEIQREKDEAKAKRQELAIARLTNLESAAAREREKMEMEGAKRSELINRTEQDNIRFLTERLRLTKEQTERLSVQNQIAQAHHQAEMDRLRLRKDLEKELADQALEVTDRQLAQLEAANAKKYELRQQEIEQEYQQRLTQLELLEASGLDPVAREFKELDARRYVLEQKLAAEQQFTNDKVAMQRIQMEMTQVAYEKEAAHLKAVRAEQEKSAEVRARITGQAIGLSGALTEAVISSAFFQKKSFAEGVRDFAKAEGQRAAIVAGREAFLAIAAAARYDFVAASQHGTAAAMAGAAAIAWGATYGIAGGSVREKKEVKPGIWEHQGASRGGPSSSGSSGSGFRGGNIPSTPLSNGGVSNTVQSQNSGAGSAQQVVVINWTSQSLEAPDEERFFQKVRRGLRDADRNFGAA